MIELLVALAFSLAILLWSIPGKQRTPLRWPVAVRRFLCHKNQRNYENALLQLEKDRVGAEWRERERLSSIAEVFAMVRMGNFAPALPRLDAIVHDLMATGDLEAARTVDLLRLEGAIYQANCFKNFPLELHLEILERGIIACESAIGICEDLQDDYCLACYLCELGDGRFAIEEFAAARECFEKSRDILVRVRKTSPHQYRSDIVLKIARAHSNLAGAAHRAWDIQSAKSNYEEAKLILRQEITALEERNMSNVDRTRLLGQTYLELGLAENDYGTLLRDCDEGDPQAAARSYEAAARSYSESVLVLAKAIAVEGRQHPVLARSTAFSNLMALLWGPRSNRSTAVSRPLLRMVEEAITSLAIDEADEPRLLGVNDRTRFWTQYAVAKAQLGDPGEASSILDRVEAEICGESPSLSLAEVYATRGWLIESQERSKKAGYEYHRKAVEMVERSLGRVESETRAWLIKADFEMSYLYCVEQMIAEKEEAEAFHLLETLRSPTLLSRTGPTHSPNVNRWFDRIRNRAGGVGVNYLALQVVPTGMIFFMVASDGEIRTDFVDKSWRSYFSGIFFEMKELVSPSRDAKYAADKYAVDKYADDEEAIDKEAGKLVGRAWSDSTADFAEAGRKLFERLPEPVREFLSTKEPLFVSSHPDIQYLPLELLRNADGWLGLKKNIARIHSFGELDRTLSTRAEEPLTRPTAAVFVDPSGDLPHARRTGLAVAKKLVESGFELYTGGAILGPNATRRRWINAAKDGVRALVFMGHGRFSKEHGAFLEMSDGISTAEDIASIELPNGAFVFLDCCSAGMPSYAPGGRQRGFGPVLIGNGAGCCLLSPRPVFDAHAGKMATWLFEALLDRKLPIGEAIMKARVAMAEECPHPAAWELPFMIGNPYLKLR